MNSLHDIIYVFSGEIGTFEYEQKPRLHLIQIAAEPSEKNIQFALKANATYFLETHVTANTLRYFKSCLAPTVIDTRVSVFTSTGVVLKFVSGPIKRFSSSGNQTIIDLKSFSRAIPPFLILRGTKDVCDCVSVQIILEIFEGHLFVMNRVWQRAPSPAAWAASVNHAWCAAPFIQLKAVEALKDIGLVTPWVVPERKVKFLKEAPLCRKKAKHLEKLITVLASNPEIFTDTQRSYFLLAGFYGGIGYYDELYDALTMTALNAPYLVIPPYIVFSGEQRQSDLGLSAVFGMASITIPAKRYSRLRTAIHDLRNELFLLESQASPRKS
jgi:hypothetical protein